MTKEKVCRKIADKTAELYLTVMIYKEAFEKAKENIYNLDSIDKNHEN